MNVFTFSPNRVRRLYRGGAGIDRMRGDLACDGYYPEDWIASCIEGNTREFQACGHGLSKIAQTDQPSSAGRLFKELLAENPEELLGEVHVRTFGCNPALLSKILDSAIRLPIQAHPTSADARKYYNVPFGKTEAWIFLSVRPGAYIYLGFNENFDEEIFRRESKEGVYNKTFDMLHKFMVEPGETVVVFGGLPHAIGEGITMIEVMEPSDLTINPEAFCGDKPIAPCKRWGGLPPETALELFDRHGYTQAEIRKRCFMRPEVIVPGLTRLISREKTGFFEAQRLVLNGEFCFDLLQTGFQVGIVTSGHARCGEIDIPCGTGFFMPHTCENKTFTGEAEIIFLLPPVKKASF